MGYKLPLLFADGYPISLNIITLKQIKRFIHLLVNHTLQMENKYKSVPNWWPEDIPFIVTTTQPACTKEQWLETLKDIVIRCYKYYDCEVLLQISEEYYNHKKDLFFETNEDGTSDMYTISNNQILCTVKNYHLLYDLEADLIDPEEEPEEDPDQTHSRKKLKLDYDTSETLSNDSEQDARFDANVYACKFCNFDFVPSSYSKMHETLCEGFNESGVIFDSYPLDNNVVNVFPKPKMP